MAFSLIEKAAGLPNADCESIIMKQLEYIRKGEKSSQTQIGWFIKLKFLTSTV